MVEINTERVEMKREERELRAGRMDGWLVRSLVRIAKFNPTHAPRVRE